MELHAVFVLFMYGIVRGCTGLYGFPLVESPTMLYRIILDYLDYLGLSYLRDFWLLQRRTAPGDE